MQQGVADISFCRGVRLGTKLLVAQSETSLDDLLVCPIIVLK